MEINPKQTATKINLGTDGKARRKMSRIADILKKPMRCCQFRFLRTSGRVATADAGRPKATDLLEVKRGMGRVAEPKLEVLPGKTPNLWRQAFEPATKLFVVEDLTKRRLRLALL